MKRKIQFFIICIFITNLCFGQEELPLNNPLYDNQIYHFGFTIGVSNSKFQINYNSDFITQNDFDQILSKHSPGFNVGIIMDLKIGKNTNLRLTPSFNFTDQKLYFTQNYIQTVKPENNTGISNFELPLYLKYRSDRINNGRAYLLLGGNFMLDMSATETLSLAQEIETMVTMPVRNHYSRAVTMQATSLS